MRQNAINEPTKTAHDEAGTGAEPHDRLAGGADTRQAPTNRSAGRMLRRFAGRLARDRRGGIALIFALTLLPIAVGAGLALDLGRAYIVESRLAYALDAAGLAVGSSEGTTAELQTLMQSYFDANYPAAELGIPATPAMNIVGDEIHLSVTAQVGTTLMNVFGQSSILVAVNNTIIRETKGLELVLVLDNTTSMCLPCSKMTALQESAVMLVDILFGEEVEPDLLKVGVVPFAQTVNIGPGNAGFVNGLVLTDFDPDPMQWRGCVAARPYPHDSRDTSVGAGGAWPPFLWPTNNYTSGSSILRMLFRNNWEPPSPNPQIRGSRGQITGPNKSCTVPVLPLTNVKADVIGTINAMEARGTTHINLGAIWGLRLLSPEPPFSEGLPYSDPDNQKAVVIMTDGENTKFQYSAAYSAYGFLSEGILGTTNRSAAEDELDDRLTEVCTEIKGQDIIVYTITFQVGSAQVQNMMRNCASDPSNYFDSPTSADLETAFRSIARELSNLRIGS